ncbi:MAG: hypothetical protein Q9204_002732 [Flavoplaca sp. TL-2023a]
MGPAEAPNSICHIIQRQCGYTEGSSLRPDREHCHDAVGGVLKFGMTPHDVPFDPNVFDEPGKFDPDRWIQKPHLERYLVIFGKGTRMCQGMR